MIVLDTNVVSEALKPQPDTRVVAWPESLTERVHLGHRVRYMQARRAARDTRINVEDCADEGCGEIRGQSRA